jgi:hypothetical protein
MENKIEEIRKSYANNLFRVARHYSSLYGNMICSRALPKYFKENISFDSIDITKPFCLYTNELALCATPIMKDNSQEVLKYIELIHYDPEDEISLAACLYNYETNTIRVLMGDESIVIFLLTKQTHMFPSGWEKNLKVM